nr:MAG TPA: hypothetical protein [Caudoviricetes sp.]
MKSEERKSKNLQAYCDACRFLVLQRGFPLTGINFDSPGATEKRIPRRKARDSFWCSSGDFPCWG